MSLRNNRPPTSFKVYEATTLMPFLMKSFDGISRNKVKAMLAGGGVSVNRRVVKQFDYALGAGDVVEVTKRKSSVTLDNKFVRLVYEDAWIVVVEKQIGILSMATSHHAFCVKKVLDEYFRKSKQKCTAHVVHRLDRDTSGLLVYAKTIEAEQTLEHNWHSIVTDRRYVALVSGRMEQAEGTVRNWLKDNKAYFTYSSPTDNGGKLAVTHFRTRRTSEAYSLVCRDAFPDSAYLGGIFLGGATFGDWPEEPNTCSHAGSRTSGLW